MASVVRQDIPPKAGPQLPIVRHTRAGQRMFRILSKSLYGIWTHWDGRRSIPCSGENKECYGHVNGMPRRWKGYLHCIDGESKEECFVEITPLAADQLLFQMPVGNSLRGLRLNLTRGPGGQKSRLKVDVLPAVSDNGNTLPEEKDPIMTLGRLWEMTKAFGPDA